MKSEGPPQSPRDRILWMLPNSGGKMERSRLRRCARMRYADLDPILLELEKEGKISRLSSPTGKEIVILRDRHAGPPIPASE